MAGSRHRKVDGHPLSDLALSPDATLICSRWFFAKIAHPPQTITMKSEIPKVVVFAKQQKG